jgi:ComEC/Rec2-related protein
MVGMYTGYGHGLAKFYLEICLGVALLSAVIRRAAPYICSFAFLYLAGVAYVNSHELENCPDLNRRKSMLLTIRPDSVDGKASENVAYGYGRVLEAPERYEKIVGHRMYFILKYDEIFPARGQKLQISTQVEYIGRRKTKPFLRFLRKNHVFLYGSNGKIEKYLSEKSWFDCICERYRGKFFHALRCGLGNRGNIGVMTGMLTGSKYMLSREQKDDFCSTGTAHIFAISGFHIGVIALFFDWFLRLFKLSRRLRALPVIAILFAYLSIIGPTSSSMRAYVTVVFYYSAALFSRRSNVFSSFTNSAAVNICLAPESIFSVSFLLSYGIVFGIICIGANLSKLLNGLRWRERWLRRRTLIEKLKGNFCSGIIDNFCVAFAASISSIPLSVEFFGNFSYLTILLNLILVPLASVVIFLGVLSLLLGSCNVFALCALVNKLAAIPISLINFTLDCSRRFGHGLVHVPYPLEGIWIPSLVLVAIIGWHLARIVEGMKSGDESPAMRRNL